MVSKPFNRLASFMWEDSLMLSRRFTEEENLISQSAKTNAQTCLLLRIIKAYNTREQTGDNEGDGRQGLFRLHGDGLRPSRIGQTSYCLIHREIEAVDSAYRSLLRVQNSLVIYPILSYANNS